MLKPVLDTLRRQGALKVLSGKSVGYDGATDRLHVGLPFAVTLSFPARAGPTLVRILGEIEDTTDAEIEDEVDDFVAFALDSGELPEDVDEDALRQEVLEWAFWLRDAAEIYGSMLRTHDF